MYFYRKAYAAMLDWKKSYADSYALLLEGARRVGKSTLAEEFAKNEYSSHVIIDFASASTIIKSCFDDIHDLDLFFLRLQAATGVSLIKNNSVIVFDEVQLFPRARQAIKFLVKDGRYHYIETGSLISIKRNVENILIPSEEMRLQIYPMDYEEFCLACHSNAYQVGEELFETGKPLGQDINRKLLRDFRLYMAIGGMPQAVLAYVDGMDFLGIDQVKRTIIDLYEADFKKIDTSGRISALFHSIPAQLSKDRKKYSIAQATGKRRQLRDDERMFELIDSKTVLASYNTTDPRVSLSLTKDLESYKLYLTDTGLFVTLMFIDRPKTSHNLYTKLLSDTLPANLGYLYENAVAQIIASQDRELYYHTWEKAGSTHYYEVDFLIASRQKIDALEVKSSGLGKYASLKSFMKKYSSNVNKVILLSQKDVHQKDGIQFLPIYMLNYFLERSEY